MFVGYVGGLVAGQKRESEDWVVKRKRVGGREGMGNGMNKHLKNGCSAETA